MAIENLGNENPIVRVLALGKINTSLKAYTQAIEPLTFLDKRLLKGFYAMDPQEVYCDHDVDPVQDLTYNENRYEENKIQSSR